MQNKAKKMVLVNVPLPKKLQTQTKFGTVGFGYKKPNGNWVIKTIYGIKEYMEKELNNIFWETAKIHLNPTF